MPRLQAFWRQVFPGKQTASSFQAQSFDAGAEVEALLAVLEATHHRPMASVQQTQLLSQSLSNIGRAAPNIWSHIWDNLEAVVQATDGRQPANVRALLLPWLAAKALPRAQWLLRNLGPITPQEVHIARRLLDKTFCLSTQPLAAELTAVSESLLRAARADVPAEYAHNTVFAAMEKWPIASAPSALLGGKNALRPPSYLHDVEQDAYYRVAPYHTNGSFMKIRRAVDEQGNRFVFRVGHLAPKAVKSGIGVLEGDAFFDENFSMQLANSALQPRKIFAHTYQRLFCLTDVIADDFFTLREMADTLPQTRALLVPMVRQATARVLDGLMPLHAHGYGHFDLKPENIFLSLEGRAELGDFGLASLADKKFDVCGSQDYLAPEMLFATEQRPTPAADMWSLGITTWYLLAPDAFAATPVARANMFENLVNAHNELSAWAQATLRGPDAADYFAELASGARLPRAKEDPYGFALAEAMRRDAELAAIILPATLVKDPSARLTAAALRTALSATFGEASLTSLAEGKQLLQGDLAPLMAKSDAAFNYLNSLPPRPAYRPKGARTP